MMGGREVLPLLEVRDASWGPVADTDVDDAASPDAAPVVDDEDAAPVVLWGPGATSPGGRTNVVVGSHGAQIRSPRASAFSLPISTALSPSSSTSWMLVGMSRCPYASELLSSARRKRLSSNEPRALFLV